MSHPRISIVIVTWNSAKDIGPCLDSLLRQDMELQIIVVDNGSSDGTVPLIKNQYSPVELIESQSNIGFAAACNQGATAARSSWLLLLNPDTVLPANCLLNWLRWAEQRPKLGASGCRLLNTDHSRQPSVRRFPSFGNMVTLLLKIHRLWPGLLNKYLTKDFDYDHESVVDQVMGAAILTPKIIYERLGGLDIKFKIWFEDVDYCYRLRTVGLETRYYPLVGIVHSGGQSFMQASSGVNQRQFINSLLYYGRKHFKFWQYLILLCLTPFSWLMFGLTLLIPRPALKRARRAWYQ